MSLEDTPETERVVTAARKLADALERLRVQSALVPAPDLWQRVRQRIELYQTATGEQWQDLPDVSSREEVLLALGEPDDVVGAGQETFHYVGRRWRRWVGILVNPWTLLAPVWSDREVTHHALEIWFDQRGLVRGVQRHPPRE